MLRQKPIQVLPKKLLKEATIHFYCLLDEPRFSNLCTIIELKELNRPFPNSNAITSMKNSELYFGNNFTLIV